MRNTFVLLIATAFLTSCVNIGSKKIDQDVHKSAFEQFVDSVPTLELPYELSTDDEMIHYNNPSSHVPEGAALMGKLPSLENVHLIVYSYPADIRLPVLELYSKDGTKLNDIQLFKYSCPLESSWNSKFLITKDYKIYIDKICDIYDSQIDKDTINIKGLLKNE